MDDNEKKLNKEHSIKMQGGSILLVLRLLSSEIAKRETINALAEKMGVEVPKDEVDMIAALDAIGTNLMIDAKGIFEIEYLNKVFGRDEEETFKVGEVEEIDPNITIN
jgi:hypothetical protein